MQGGAPPYRNNFIGRASSGRNRNPPVKNGPPAHCSQLAVLQNFGFVICEAPSAIYHLARIHTCRQSSDQRDFQNRVMANRLPKSVITSLRSQPTTEGHPLKHVTQLRLQLPISSPGVPSNQERNETTDQLSNSTQSK